MNRAPALGLVLLAATFAAAASCSGDDDDDPGGTGGTGGAHAHGGSSSSSTASNTGGTAGAGGSTTSPSTTSTTATTTGSGGSGNTGGGGGAPAPCPPDMAFADTFCMDRYEAPNQAGVDPLVMQSALDAEAWCEGVGKRLCTEDEWVKACEGPSGYKYPYGDTHVASRCNDDETWKVVNEGALNTWPSAAAQAEVDKLWQGEPSGSNAECVSGYGVFDLTGNIEEWVVRTQPHTNNYPHVLKGCYWAGCYGGAKPTCASTNPAHASAFRYYETGFRCCRDLGP